MGRVVFCDSVRLLQQCDLLIFAYTAQARISGPQSPEKIEIEKSFVPLGAEATIHCETTLRLAMLEWCKNGEPLVDDGRITKTDSEDGTIHTVTIQKVRESDEGVYGVLINGCHTATTKIVVIGLFSVKIPKIIPRG